jgi:hypothetical protein
MDNSYIHTLFFQVKNIMQFKNRFYTTANGPLSVILRSFVRTALIILILPQSSASLFASHPLA